MTESELQEREAVLAGQVKRAERMLGQIKFAHRHLLLCSAVVYLAGIVLGVAMAKLYWGL